MTMTAEEERRFHEMEEAVENIRIQQNKIEAQLNSIFNVVTGNDPYSKGLSFVERFARIEKTQAFIRVLLIGIGIGVLLGGLIFGVLTLKTVVDAIKTVKP